MAEATIMIAIIIIIIIFKVQNRTEYITEEKNKTTCIMYASEVKL